MRLSILFPVFATSERTLEINRLCLESIRAVLVTPGIEVIVVDDASPHPRTSEVIEAVHHPRMRVVVNERNLGLVRSLNLAAREAKGKYLNYCHSDCLVPPNAFDPVLECLSQSRRAGMIASALYNLDGSVQNSGCWINEDLEIGWYKNEVRNTTEVDWSDFWTIRRSLFGRIGGLSTIYGTAYYEGVDLGMSVKELGYRVVLEPSSRVTHYGHASFWEALDASKRRQLILTNRLKFQLKWKRRASAFKSRLTGVGRRPEYWAHLYSPKANPVPGNRSTERASRSRGASPTPPTPPHPPLRLSRPHTRTGAR